MITEKSKTLKSFRLSQAKKQKVSYGVFFVKQGKKKNKSKIMVYRYNYRYVF